jgi:hypothetical protein
MERGRKEGRGRDRATRGPGQDDAVTGPQGDEGTEGRQGERVREVGEAVRGHKRTKYSLFDAGSAEVLGLFIF